MKQSLLSWTLIASTFLLFGCMELPQQQPNTIPTTGLAATLQKLQTSREVSLAKLADECKTLEAQSPDAAKTNWNTKYHSIVGNYVTDVTDAVKGGFDKATTSSDRSILWEELKKGFGP